MKDKISRADKEFVEFCKRVAAKRYATGRDKRLRSTARITKAIYRSKDKFERDLLDADFKD